MPSTPDDDRAPEQPEEQSEPPAASPPSPHGPAAAPPPPPSPYGPAAAPPPPVPPAGPPPGPAHPSAPAGPPPRRGMSFGAGVGTGVGVGCGAYLLGAVLVIATLGVVGNIFGFLWPFLIIAVVAIALMFSPRTRGVGTGILIVSAAAWITVLGPCIALLGGFG